MKPWAIWLIVPLMSGCVDGSDEQNDAGLLNSKGDSNLFGTAINGTMWETTLEGPMSILWKFEGDGFCIVRLSASGPGELEKPAMIGYNNGDSWRFISGTLMYNKARVADVEVEDDIFPFTSPPYSYDTLSLTLRASDLQLFVSTTDAHPVDGLQGASIHLMYLCDDNVRLVGVEAGRTMVYWAGDTVSGDYVVVGGSVAAHIADVTQTFEAPQVLLISEERSASYVGTVTLNHPTGTKTFDLPTEPVRFAGGPGEYRMTMQRAGVSTPIMPIALVGLYPLESMDELALLR